MWQIISLVSHLLLPFKTNNHRVSSECVSFNWSMLSVDIDNEKDTVTAYH